MRKIEKDVKVPQTLDFFPILLVESGRSRVVNRQDEVYWDPHDPSSCVYMSCVHIYPARAHVHFQASI